MNRALRHFSIIVPDYDEAIDYYTNVLGFHLKEDRAVVEQNKRWVVVSPSEEAGATSIVLARASNAEQKAAIGKQMAGRVGYFLSTDDFYRDHELFSLRGVVFIEEPRHEPYGIVAVFQDCYGNLWDLIQEASPT